MCLACLLCPCVRQEHYYLRRNHLAVGVSGEYRYCCHERRKGAERAIQKGEIKYQSHHAIGADVRVFHYLQYPLTVVAAPAETVEEVGETVLMECSRQ